MLRFFVTRVDVSRDAESRIVCQHTIQSLRRFVSAVRETGASLVGISALLTSTIPEMRSVIDALREAGLRSRVRIAVGGAPVTPAFAKEIGADGTAEDGVSALRLFQRLAGETRETRGEPGGVASSRETRHAS